MKTCLLLFLTSWGILFSCSSKSDPLPADTWSEACIELAPYKDAYRLSGMCCEYIELPKITLDNNRSFSYKGTYFTFTGAGFIGSPVVVSGQLASNGTTLVLSYTVNSVSTTRTLKAGHAKVACLCGCD